MKKFKYHIFSFPNNEIYSPKLTTVKKIIFIINACMLTITYAQAQHEIRDNTFGGLGAGLIAPQGYYKNNVNSGFQINGEINGRIYRPLWFYVGGAYESLPAANTVINTAGPVSTLGGGLGLKIFLVKFIYVNGGAGIRAVVSGSIPNSDNSTIYYECGGGVYLLKFLNVFVNYTSWQAQTGYPANNYFVAGLKFSFGRK
jgi:hypothetical protein